MNTEFTRAVSTGPRPPLRVAVATVPPLLADSLRALLACDDVEVTLVTAATAQHFDVAVVSVDSPAVPADLVVTLADEPEGTRDAVLITDAVAKPIMRLSRLTDLADLLHRLGASRRAWSGRA